MRWIAACSSALSISPQQVQTVTTLLRQQDATVPFIVRYRADATGGLDEQQVLSIKRMMSDNEAIEARREAIVRALEKKGDTPTGVFKLLRAASSLTELEDVYAPHKAGRTTTLADKARAEGHALAESIWSGSVPDGALRRARDEPGLVHILAEHVSESVDGELRCVISTGSIAAWSPLHPKCRRAQKGAASGSGGGGGSSSGGGGGGHATAADRAAEGLIGTTWRVCQVASSPRPRDQPGRGAQDCARGSDASRPRTRCALCTAALPHGRPGACKALRKPPLTRFAAVTAGDEP